MCQKETVYYNQYGQIEIIEVVESQLNYKLHNHSHSYTVLSVLKGSIELKPEPNYLLLNKGDIYCIKPYEVHKIASIKAYSLIAIILPITYLQVKDGIAIRKQVEEGLMKTYLYSQLEVNKRKILLDYIENVKQDEADYDFNEEIEKVIQWCKQHPERFFSLETISKETYFSPYHYLRTFKNQVGLTPHQFLIQNRIRKAQQLLRENRQVAEVALLVGFYDQSHFIRHFKELIGITPSAYKKVCTNKEQE